MLEVYFWVNKRYKNTYPDNLSCFELSQILPTSIHNKDKIPSK